MTFRLRDELFQAIVYLYPDEASAAAGESAGGSGFLLGWQSDGDPSQGSLWAVTNRHVIEKGAWTIRVNTKVGSFDLIDTDDTQWIFDDDHDLAVMPLALSGDFHQFYWMPNKWLLKKEWADALHIGPGDPCHTVGRFVGRDGKIQNTPTARFGQIAQSYTEPLDGEESYLVEIRSIGGFSGSPVLVWLDMSHGRNQIYGKTGPDGGVFGPLKYPDGPWVLGVNWCMVPSWEPVCGPNGVPLPNGWQVPANTGMMGVIPAWHLWNLIDTGKASKKRIEIQNILAARAQIITPSAIETSGEV